MEMLVDGILCLIPVFVIAGMVYIFEDVFPKVGDKLINLLYGEGWDK